ncbi:hypothetical protein C0991_001948 [Blastosporella zonata]|nr:hypothetical protein C0991_001948 [Blastosporella zonata]
MNEQPISLLFDVVEVAESHSGLVLASAFAKVLEDFDVSDKILSITCDNATTNDVMIDKLGYLLDDYPGATSHTRCFAHIVNLIAKSLLKQFDVPKKKADDALRED